MDARMNILRNPKFWVGAAACLLAVTLGPYYAYKSLTGFGVAKKEPEKGQSGPQTVAEAAKAAQAPPRPVGPSAPPYSDSWHIAGRYSANGDSWIVLSNSAGRIRVVSPSMFSNSGLAMVGVVDDTRVTNWTGASSPAGLSPLEPKK